MPDEQVKIAFLKVKQDIQQIIEEITILREELKENRRKIEEITIEFNESRIKSINAKEEDSTGNEGANHLINHLGNQSINQSIINQSFDQSNSENKPKNHDKATYTDNQSFNQSFGQSQVNQSFNHLINHLGNQSNQSTIKTLTSDLSKMFLSFSKQELKLFLTIYQLEDEGLEPAYKDLSIKMQLSEHCIRSHLSSLLKKNAPIFKKRLNNHKNILSISKEFRVLDLKQKLISLYYDLDPHQKTLFDVN